MMVNADHKTHHGFRPGSPRISIRFPLIIRSLALACLIAGVLLTILESSSAVLAQSTPSPRIDILTLDSTITNVSHVYVDRGIDQARDHGASAVLIELDSAGGDASAADSIANSILNSTVPVIVYVPEAKTVRGAAVTILVAGNIAAMAPGATIGDASRVAGGSDASASDKRVITRLQNLSTDRGRKTGWASGSVKNSIHLTADQAKAAGIIDEIAPDRASLFTAINGKSIQMESGERVTLSTASAESRAIKMTLFERFRAFITSPSVAYVLLCFGVLGIFFELASPGGFVAGTIGIACFASGIYAFSALPLNWTGLGLMMFAFVLLGIDLFVTSFGVLTLGGLASFIAGSYIVIDTGIIGYDPVSRPVIWTATACVIGYSLFVGLSAVRSFRKKPVTGRKAMIGEIGTVRDRLDPHGMIFVQGELWQARVPALPKNQSVPVGTKVEVTAINGLLLDVRPVSANVEANGDTSSSRLFAQLDRIDQGDRNTPRGSSVLPIEGGVESLRP